MFLKFLLALFVYDFIKILLKILYKKIAIKNFKGQLQKIYSSLDCDEEDKDFWE